MTPPILCILIIQWDEYHQHFMGALENCSWREVFELLTSDRAPIAEQRIPAKANVACQCIYRAKVRGYLQEPKWSQSHHTTTKFHPCMDGDFPVAT